MPSLQILAPGQIVHTQPAAHACEVIDLIGEGAQGEVYRARLADRMMALKWYHPSAATAQQRASLDRLIRKGPPNNRFLWPIEMAIAQGVTGFGYLMPLREERFRGLVDLMKRQVDPTFRALATAGFELANSFLQLHSKGLCYRDISFGNLFLDPISGEILICDNDNVTVDGDLSTGILGTPRFMAPEVVRGDALPSIQTDLFSLSVLLFYLFVVHHPLEGRKELAIHSFDLPAMTRIYGTEPVFIYDPYDRSNEPVPGFHDNALVLWPLYPQFLRDLFVRAFREGIADPEHGRVREGEWRAAMVRLRDSIVYCSNCAAENFYDPESGGASSGGPAGGICWSCQRRFRLPFRIRIGRSVIVLNHNTELYPHHLDDQRVYDFSAPVAAVTAHPTQAGVWGLRNLSGESWFFQTVYDASPTEVSPGRAVPLADGLRIHFGSSEAVVRN